MEEEKKVEDLNNNVEETTNTVESLDDSSADVVESLDSVPESLDTPAESPAVEDLNSNEEVASTNNETESTEQPVEEKKEEVKTEKPKKNSKILIYALLGILVIGAGVAFALLSDKIFNPSSGKKPEGEEVDFTKPGNETQEEPDTSEDETELTEIIASDVKSRLELIVNTFSSTKTGSLYSLLYGTNLIRTTDKLAITFENMKMPAVDASKLTDEAKNQIGEGPLSEGKIVFLEFSELETNYEKLTGQKLAIEKDLITRSISCPTLVYFDKDDKKMYFNNSCAGIGVMENNFKVTIDKYMEGKDHYYVETTVIDNNSPDTSNKLKWKFDKNYRLLKTQLVFDFNESYK